MTGRNFTKDMRALVQSRLSGLHSFYCREDLEAALRRVKRAPADGAKFPRERLDELCRAVGLEARALLRNEALLETIPSRAQQKEQLLDLLWELHTVMPHSENYMERIVRRLAPEYRYDSVPLAILKKFLLGAGFGWKTFHTDTILAWAEARLPAVPTENRLQACVDALTDQVFEELGAVQLTDREELGLMMRRMQMCTALQLLDETGTPLSALPLSLSPQTGEALSDYCRRHGLPEADPVQCLRTIAASELPVESSWFEPLRKDFLHMTRRIQYINKNGAAEAVYALYKTDRKDARLAKGRGTELLKLCQTLADGVFYSNSKRTKVYLYYFAIMFGMEVQTDPDTPVAPDRDLEKNLFGEYYSDNLLRFLSQVYDDPKTASSYEREPTGEGVNYKNFVEVILLYYLCRRDLPLTPGQRIDRAEATADRCVRLAASKEYRDKALTQTPQQYTVEFQDLFLQQVLGLDEGQLAPFLVEHLLIREPGQPVRILVSDESFTACDLIEMAVEELNDDFETTALLADIDYGDDRTAPKHQKDLSDAADLTLRTRLAELLEARFPEDEAFLRVIRNLNHRISVEFDWNSTRRKHFLASLLQCLYHRTAPIKLEPLKRLLEDYEPLVTGAMVTESAELLQKLGFDVRRTVERDSSVFRLADRPADCPILAMVAREADPEALVQALDARMLERKLTYRSVSRTTLLAAYTRYYIGTHMNPETLGSFPALYRDYAGFVNPALQEARFQPISEKNMLDLYLLISIYFYVFDDRD